MDEFNSLNRNEEAGVFNKYSSFLEKPVYSGNCVMFWEKYRTRVIVYKNVPWFLLKDLGELLKLKNIKQNLTSIPSEETKLCYAYVRIGNFKEQRRRVRVINEAGLYRLIFMSRTLEAEKFKTWVVRDVLPSIMRTGKYENRKRSMPMIYKSKNLSETDVSYITLAQKGNISALEWII